VIANLVAMPAVSVWVMPTGILGVMSMPLGIDGFWWRVMEEGIDWMIAVAQWVTSFPGALGRVAAFGTVPCCWHRPVSWYSACSKHHCGSSAPFSSVSPRS